MKIWEPKPPETLWATLGLLRDTFTFHSQLILRQPFNTSLDAIQYDRRVSFTGKLRKIQQTQVQRQGQVAGYGPSV